MALAASPPTHHAAHTHTVAVSNSSPLMRISTAPRDALGDSANPHLYSLLRPCTERAIDAARRLLSLAMLPSEIACSALSEATSLCELVQGGLRSLSSRRDTPLDDNVSSTAPNPQHALPSPSPAHAFAASAADSSSLQGVENASSTAHPRCRQCNSALGTGTHSPAEGRHWATECPAEGRHGLHWGTECPAEGRHGLHWARECRPKAGTGARSARP